MGMGPGQGPGGPGYPPPPPGGPGYPPPYYPPPYGYGGLPPYGYPYAPPPPPPPPPPAPAGINGLFQKWINVTTKPGAASFAIELPTANWSDIWLSIIGLSVLTAITSFISALLYRSSAVIANMSQLTPDQQRAFNQIMQFARPAPAAAIVNIISVPLSFFLGVGILFLFAKLFGGTGTFLQQAYAFALFSVPIQGVSALVGLVPVLGGLVSAGLGIYGIFLAVFAISASQRLTSGKAVAVVLLPAAIFLVLAFVALIVFVAILVATTHNR
jgi:Yip1-like protein